MSTQQRKAACECGNETFYFVKDLNLDKVWKAGNKYARLCTACGARYFLSEAMWERADDHYVILRGDDAPVPLFSCPACGESVTGTPDQCPFCEAEFDWSHYSDPGDRDSAPDDDDDDDDDDDGSGDNRDRESGREREHEREADDSGGDTDGDHETESGPEIGPDSEAEIEAEVEAEAEGDGGGETPVVPERLRACDHPDDLRAIRYNDMKTLASMAGLPAQGSKDEVVARLATLREAQLPPEHDHHEAWVAAATSAESDENEDEDDDHSDSDSSVR